MTVLWITAVILASLYLLLIGIFFSGWIRLPVDSSGSPVSPAKVSVIIPVRNEELNIVPLINALRKQDYPQNQMEIMIIDDHSTDLTFEMVMSFIKRYRNIRYLRLGDGVEGKKNALVKGVSMARYPLVLTTDADCVPSPGWVKTMAGSLISSGADLVSGPVLMDGPDTFFSKFQRLEFLSLTGSTAGSIAVGKGVMCSSANLAFKKDAYIEVKDGIRREIASGDDVFLLMAMQSMGDKKISYLKDRDAIVSIGALNTMEEFFKQRRRWTSKSRYYRNPASVFTALLVFLVNFFAAACILVSPVFPQLLLTACFIIFVKSVIDFPFLLSVSRFFGQQNLMKYFPVVQLLYLFYISFTVITSFYAVFDWKGRLVK